MSRSTSGLCLSSAAPASSPATATDDGVSLPSWGGTGSGSGAGAADVGGSGSGGGSGAAAGGAADGGKGGQQGIRMSDPAGWKRTNSTDAAGAGGGS